MEDRNSVDARVTACGGPAIAQRLFCIPMCLALFAYHHHPRYRLVLAANRDEFYERPTAPADFWGDESGLLAGRDLKGGGTWLGITRTGRYAAVTNYRDREPPRVEAPSRGALVAGYLGGRDGPEAFLERLAPTADRYNGFNLLVGDLQDLFYFSNREGRIRRLDPGLYGLSNHLLNTPWPKVEQGRRALAAALEQDPIAPELLLDLLKDEAVADDRILPDTGVGPEWERALSPLYIRTPVYGTRSSTALLIDREGTVTFVEESGPVHDAAPEVRAYHFRIEAEP